MKTVKTVTINPECKSFDRKNFICTHIVNITYTDDTQHNLVMSATNIMNFYSQYINDSLRFHFSLYNDKLLLDEDYFIALDEANINKYLIKNNCCSIS
mgnify:CR=1 FL=1